MEDDYKYKNLPRAANGIAPAYWDEEEKQWLPYQGGADMVKELNDIKATQAKILERLDKPLDTQVTGSNVEDEEAIPVRSTGRMKVVSNLENIEFSAGSSVYLRHLSEGIITDIDTITILLRWLDTEPDDYNIVVSYYSSGTTSNGVTMEDTYSKDILKKEIKLLSPYVSVYLMNKTTTDATIRTAIVTGG